MRTEITKSLGAGLADLAYLLLDFADPLVMKVAGG
jgi:hypothetical protein